MEIRNLKLAITMASLAGMIITPSLFAHPVPGIDGTLYITNSPYRCGDGGEFVIITMPYSGTPKLGRFSSFCLETGEVISQPPTGLYTYTINSGAVTGDQGADATDPHTGLPMDNISLGTAWLFSQFAAGILTLDNGTGSYFSGNRTAHAGELQQAIWYLENEAGGLCNGYVILAENALHKNLAELKADSNGTYGVVALNLFNPGCGLAQDMLAIVPEPTTIVLTACGLAALLVLRRGFSGLFRFKPVVIHVPGKTHKTFNSKRT